MKKKKRNKRAKNQGDQQVVPAEEEDIDCENLYGLEEDELDNIEKAA